MSIASLLRSLRAAPRRREDLVASPKRPVATKKCPLRTERPDRLAWLAERSTGKSRTDLRGKQKSHSDCQRVGLVWDVGSETPTEAKNWSLSCDRKVLYGRQAYTPYVP